MSDATAVLCAMCIAYSDIVLCNKHITLQMSLSFSLVLALPFPHAPSLSSSLLLDIMIDIIIRAPYAACFATLTNDHHALV